jgi:hypothetical protein
MATDPPRSSMEPELITSFVVEEVGNIHTPQLR